MNEYKSNTIPPFHERGTRYVVDTNQQPIGMLLSLTEHQHYLDLLATETALQDEAIPAIAPVPSTQLCGRWQDDCPVEELVAEIMGARSMGREFPHFRC